MMVGRDVLFDTNQRETTIGEPLLEAEELFVSGDRGLEQVSGVDFTVRSGEILGIAGVQGNGQSELIEALTGLRTPDAGTIQFQDDEITTSSRRDRIEAGIAYIPEDRHAEGLVMDYDLVQNGLLGNQTVEPYAQRGIIDWDAVREHSAEIVEEFDVEPHDVDHDAEDLSGGNQQKFIVGREIGHDPDALIAAHPTRGVDVGSIEFIHDRLLELRDQGLGVLVVSSKLEEIQKLSDRIAVMYEGEFIDVVDPEAVTEEEIGLLMAGQEIDSADTTDGERTDDDVDSGVEA